MLQFLKVLEANPPQRKPVISILINCGFLEYEQNKVAMQMMELFCRRNGYRLGARLMLGSGEAILDTPFRFVAHRAVDKLARAVARGEKRVFAASMLLNTFLNYILIFGKLGAPALGVTGAAIATLTSRIFGKLGAPALGVTGAAIATLTSRIVEFAIVAAAAAVTHRVPLRPKALLRPGRAMIRSFIKYASPVIINESFWGLGTTVMTAIMGHMAISADMLAAYAIMGNIDKFSTVTCFGVAGATAVIVGKRIGEGAGKEEVYSLGCCLLTVSLGVGVAVAAALAVLLPTVFVPYLYPLFHLEGLALRIAVTMCVVYICMMPMKAFDITNITGLLRAGGDARMASVIDLAPLWVVAVPLTALAALMLDAPVTVVCLCIQTENLCKMPVGILRLRSRKWINDITRGGGPVS